jgi:hypothetical protein
MTYSKSRISGIAVFWILAATVVFSLGMFPAVDMHDFGIGVDAQQQPRGCDASATYDNKCAFPAEGNVGGIVLGTDFLDGKDLTYLNEAADGSAGIEAPVGPDRAATTSDGSGQDRVTTAFLGLNVDSVSNFFLFKSWRYNDDTHTSGNPGTEDDVYVWVSTRGSTELQGTPECARTDQSRNKGDIETAREECDLYTETGELSAGEIFAEGSAETTWWIPTDISLSTSANDYWVTDPHQDSCSVVFDVFLGSGLCLSVADPSIDVGGAVNNVQINTIEISELMIRGHRVAAQPDPVKEENKELILNDGYLEIRHGVGADRAYVPNTGFAQPTVEDPNDQTRQAALSNPWPCNGNPTGDFGTCQVDAARQGFSNLDDSYNDIYR